MSSIPEAAMHHAKAHDDQPQPKAKEEKTGGILATVKAHPVAAAAVGATVVAGAVAAAAAPLLRDHKPAAKRKTPAKRTAAKKPVARKPATKTSAS